MPLPNAYLQARHVVRDPRNQEQEIITWWVPQFAEPVISLASLNTMADDLSDIVAAPFIACMPSLCEYVGTALRSSQGGVVFSTESFSSRGFGTAVGDVLPPQNAVVVRKFSGVPGRPGMGRWFIPCVPEGFADDDALTVVGATAYNALADALAGVQTLNGSGWNPAHRSKKNDTLLPIVAHDVQEFIASQDRRAFRSLL